LSFCLILEQEELRLKLRDEPPKLKERLIMNKIGLKLMLITLLAAFLVILPASNGWSLTEEEEEAEAIALWAEVLPDDDEAAPSSDDSTQSLSSEESAADYSTEAGTTWEEGEAAQ
jgi:hypothetical protein